MTFTATAVATLQDVLADDELMCRPPRTSDPWPEILALQTLTKRAVTAPDEVLPTLVEQAMALCRAQSASISLLEQSADGAPVFRWLHTRGVYGRFDGLALPADVSPCGLTLERGEIVLMQKPERYYSYLQSSGIVNVEALLTPLFGSGGAPVGTLWVVMHDGENKFDAGDVRTLAALSGVANVALQARAEQQLQAQTIERERLLSREVGHRINNNLQLLVGLLSIQSRTVESDATRAALGDAMQRVRTIAGLSHLLYEKRSMLQIDLDLALREVCQQLADPRFALTFTGETLPASPDVGTNVCVLACEFIANAMKHGQGVATRIDVGLRRVDGGLELEVRDDGPGLPAGFDPALSKGLGMRIAICLTQQCGGTFSFDADHGTAMRITFPDAQLRT
ncbi:MAG: Signal transduction histidine kinase [Rhodospirillales bacterium]|nr:Signal transduction histidine kinase [Rhodospirillales bacterium]